MTSARRPLGDSHNFGRRVEIHRGRVHKPRSVFWEWLLLSRDSPIRRILGEAFDFLPTLRFYEDADGGGAVEQVKLKPLGRLSNARRQQLAEIVGRTLALWSWLGVADLHWENLVLGMDAGGRIVFGPLDIEMMLADLASPTETKLLPDPDPEYALVCRHAAGVRRVLPYLGKPIRPLDLVALLAAYRETLLLLEQRRSAIAETLNGLPIGHEPIRVLLRGTGDYLRPVRELWPPLLPAEREQLARGDIPYFFRLYGNPGIHYFRDAGLKRIGTLPREGDVPQLESLLDVGKGLRSRNRERLLSEGLLATTAAFDFPACDGTHSHANMAVTWEPRRLRLAWPGGELTAPRDLRHLSSSVYLPCACGEARSVFVPEVTKCTSPLRNV